MLRRAARRRTGRRRAYRRRPELRGTLRCCRLPGNHVHVSPPPIRRRCLVHLFVGRGNGAKRDVSWPWNDSSCPFSNKQPHDVWYRSCVDEDDLPVEHTLSLSRRGRSMRRSLARIKQARRRCAPGLVVRPPAFLFRKLAEYFGETTVRESPGWKAMTTCIALDGSRDYALGHSPYGSRAPPPRTVPELPLRT